MRYNNYHKHDHYGNPWISDTVTKVEDYCKRAVELGHSTLFTTNHGMQGNIFDCMESAQKYGLQMCYGAEMYYVKDRFEKDRSNRHIIIIAKNNDGAMQLNDIISEAHSTGFYYRPRIDYDLLFSLDSNNVIITTACVAGLWRDNELMLALHRKFGENFFLEMQDHNIDIQKEANKKLLEFSKMTGIPIIHANDSHYIYPSDDKYRALYLRAKRNKDDQNDFAVEDGMILDYPDSDTIYERYEKQGILTRAQVTEAINNTLVFDNCEPITIINDEIKLPSVSDHPQEELTKIIYSNWNKEKQTIPAQISWKPYKDASAFRLYCKGIGMDISEYDDVAKNIDDYRDDSKWGKHIKESERFVGVVDSISESPCSMLLYDKSVRRELGLVRTPNKKVCCLLDGINCDKYKYLKNDYLTVTVWAIIRDVCDMAGIPIPTIREMDKLLDEKTFNVYEDGLTSTINQADSDFATGIVKTYKPTSVSEMSAFVAIIRPGCASLLQDFINRKDYTTGVPELDDLLIEGKHRMIYQELIMKYLIWLGIPETGSYDIIKKIAKKKFKEPELEELKGKLLKGWISRVGKEDGFKETWTVVEQAAHYSFNASHSLSYAYDSLYGAYLKSHYPLEYYTVALNYYADDSKRTMALTHELPYYNIQLKPIRFRYSRAKYAESKDDNSIYKGIESIKDMSANTAEALYTLRDKQYNSFMELLFDAKELPDTKISQIKILASLGYFSEFGDENYLLEQIKLFERFYGKVQVKKLTLDELNIPITAVTPFASKETAKQFSGVDSKGFLIEAAKHIKYHPLKLSEKIRAQIEYLGYIDIVSPQYDKMAAAMSVDTKYAPKLKLYSLKNGTTLDCKIDKRTFNKEKIKEGDIVSIQGVKRKPKVRRTEDGKYVEIPDTSELWITKYQVLQNF